MAVKCCLKSNVRQAFQPDAERQRRAGKPDVRLDDVQLSGRLSLHSRRLVGFRATEPALFRFTSRIRLAVSSANPILQSQWPRADFESTAKEAKAMSGVLPDWVIERDIKIVPFAPSQSRKGTISYGVTSYGYDVRVDRHYKVFTNAHCSIVDPKNFDSKSFVDIEADFCLIPPNSFALAETVEYLEIPRDVIAVCVGKSTYARCGIIVNVTPLEPEWRGRVTIEISNTTPLPAKIYSGEGIAQILFFRAQEICKISYADKKGKYQDQLGLTLPFVHPAS
jgi:dCTP deaminase